MSPRAVLAALLLAATVAGCASKKEKRRASDDEDDDEPRAERSSASAALTSSASSGPTSARVALPLPPADRVWTGQDYAAAAKVLTSADQRSLPRRDAPVFKRMISSENYAFIGKPNAPLADLLPAFELLAGLGQVTQVYVSALQRGTPVARELLEISVATTCMAAKLMPAAERLADSIDPAAPDAEARKGGLVRMREGIGKIAGGAVLTLSERSTYTVTDRAWYAGTVLPCVGELLGFVPEASRLSVLSTLSTTASNETNADILAAMRALEKQEAGRPRQTPR